MDLLVMRWILTGRTWQRWEKTAPSCACQRNKATSGGASTPWYPRITGNNGDARFAANQPANVR